MKISTRNFQMNDITYEDYFMICAKIISFIIV